MRDLGEIEDRSIRAQVVIETARLRDWPQDLCAPVIASADDVPVLLAEVQELRESLKEREAVDPRVNIPLTPPDPPHRSSHYTIQKLESFVLIRKRFSLRRFMQGRKPYMRLPAWREEPAHCVRSAILARASRIFLPCAVGDDRRL